jgi:AmpD protein
MRLAQSGWMEGIEHIPSPNFDARPDGVGVDLVVIHAISLPPGEYGGPGIIELFTNRLDCAAHPYYAGLSGLRVSAHFLIRRDGTAIQFVSTHDRAWHAGVSRHRGRERCNDFSIGIELEGCDADPFTDPQYATLEQLLRELARHHPLRDIAGHCHIAPERKTDPGPHFDWDRLPSFFHIEK